MGDVRRTPLTTPPQVGDTITGACGGPGQRRNRRDLAVGQDDGRRHVMASWMDIQGATNAAYMVAAGDTGYYLRVMATYMDAVGTDTAMEYSPATMMVGGAEAGDPLLAEYDPDSDGTIERADMRIAVSKFFADPPELSRSDMRRLVGIYFR